MTKQNLHRRASVAAARRRLPNASPFGRVFLDSTSTKLTGIVTYLHPTKGWRFRRPTAQLGMAIANVALAARS